MKSNIYDNMPTPSGYCGGPDGSTPYGDFMKDADAKLMERLANIMNEEGRGGELPLAIALIMHEAFKQGFTCGFEAVNSECLDYLDMTDAINYVCRVMDLPDVECVGFEEDALPEVPTDEQIEFFRKDGKERDL